VAKLQVYKFVNPGTVGKAGPEVTAARKQTLAFNRMGGTISSIGNIVSDIEKISIAQIKDDRARAQAERRRQRRELDAATEDAAEQKKLAKQKPNFGNAAKKVAKGSLSWIEKFLGPIGEFLLKLGTIAITMEVLKWVGDPQNKEKLKTFLVKTKFVFEKLFGWAAGFTNNVLDGFSALTDPNGTFISRLGGLGTLMKGLIGLRYLMNPFALISDILGLVDMLGRRGDRPPRIDKKKRVTQELTDQATRRAGREATEQVTRRTAGELAEQGGKRTGGQILKYGGKNISRATHRFFLKVIGRGGVRGLKKLIGKFKVPLVSGLLTAALNWIMGESIAKSLMMGVGDGIGTFLGGWAGGAIGALGGPAAPITVPLGAFVGSMLGGIAGEAIGGYLYDLMLGKADLGADLGAMGKKLVNGMKSLWNDYIMNGEFWAGAWQTFLNIGADVMSSAWGAINNMWNFASSKTMGFIEMMMEASEPFREAITEAFMKYVVNGPQELAKVVFETILSGARGVGQLFTEGAPILLQMIKQTAQAAFNWVFEKVGILFDAVRNNLFNPWGAIGALLDFINPKKIPERLREMMSAVGNKVSKTVADAFAKAKEIGGAIIEPVMRYLGPAIRAIQESYKLATNLGGWVYENGIKPFFDAINSVWNSGPAIWEFLHRPNTFQEITGQEVPQQEMFLGGLVKGAKKAFSGVSKAVGGVMQSPVGQVLGTAASFIPGAAPIMAGINTLATGNPMSMLGMIPGVSGMMGSVGNAISGVMNSPLGQIGSSLLSGNFMGAATTGLGMINPGLGQLAGSVMKGGFSPMNMISGFADQFGMGGIMKAVTGAFGNPTAALNEIGAQLGVDPRVLGTVQSAGQKVLKEGGLSAQYAMQQTMEFIPVPMILEKIVPIPQAVPINNGGGVVNAVPTSLQTRMR